MEIYIVDDNETNRIVLEHRVKKWGYKTTCFRDGHEIVEQCREDGLSQAALVLMDIRMPIKDGITATREIKEMGFDKPVIAVTAEFLSINKTGGIFSDVEKKPFNKDELHRKISRCIDEAACD